MWKICASSSLFFLLIASGLSGQGSFSGGGASQTARAGAVAPTDGMLESNTFLEMADRVFDPDSDSLDFENGSFNWKGKTFNLAEQRAFRSRFERFLLASPSEEERRYAQLMKDILDRLSVANSSTDEEILFETWELLFRASEFDIDGGNSTIVANQVFNAWRIRKENQGVSLSQRELERLRKYQQDIVANREASIRKLRERRLSETSQGEQVEESTEVSEDSIPSEAAFRAIDLAETEARILALEAQEAATGLQAKAQFQSQIIGFLLQRRFQHALVLSGFYQWLFKGSHQNLEVESGELEAFLPGSNLSYTVDSMSFIAREAINDVNKGIDSVNSAYDEGRIVIAIERLQEVFFLGEYMPRLNEIPTEQRRHLFEVYRNMIEARELADAKDYEGIEEIANKLAELADDFPIRRVLSAVETAKSVSNMAIFAAVQYRNLGDIERAREELMQAIEIWPSNPAISEFKKETTKLATAETQGIRIFDDLYERNDRRGIYENRLQLGSALSEDAERKQRLMEVIEEVARIDLLVKQSQEFVKQDEAYAAWELLVEAAKIDATDGPMNQARAELAPRVADYVLQLDRASRLSADGQHAGALAAYLAAQDIYPASRIGREGVAREAAALMQGLEPKPKVESE